MTKEPGSPPEGGVRRQKTRIERMLSAIADVRRGETMVALLMTLLIFLILVAYYELQRPVRFHPQPGSSDSDAQPGATSCRQIVLTDARPSSLECRDVQKACEPATELARFVKRSSRHDWSMLLLVLVLSAAVPGTPGKLLRQEPVPDHLGLVACGGGTGTVGRFIGFV